MTTKRRVQVGIEEIAYYLHVPIQEAAQKLGICVALLKRICRQYGMKRWLHRKIMSVNRHVESYRGSAPSMTAKLAKRLSSLRTFRDTVLGHMQSTPIDNLIFNLQPLPSTPYANPNPVILSQNQQPSTMSSSRSNTPIGTTPSPATTPSGVSLGSAQLESISAAFPHTPTLGGTPSMAATFASLFGGQSPRPTMFATPKTEDAPISPRSGLPSWMFNPRTRTQRTGAQTPVSQTDAPSTPPSRMPSWVTNSISTPLLSPRTQSMLFASGTNPPTPDLTRLTDVSPLALLASVSPMHASPPSTPQRSAPVLSSSQTSTGAWQSSPSAPVVNTNLSESTILARRAQAAADQNHQTATELPEVMEPAALAAPPAPSTPPSGPQPEPSNESRRNPRSMLPLSPDNSQPAQPTEERAAKRTRLFDTEPSLSDHPLYTFPTLSHEAGDTMDSLDLSLTPSGPEFSSMLQKFVFSENTTPASTPAATASSRD